MTFKSTTQPLCHYCGIVISKHSTRHYFGENVGFYASSPDRAIHHGERPVTREQAQKYINEQIISVAWSELSKDGDLLPRDQQFIRSVTVWDGESYDDEFFCSGDHAKRFGYVTAREGRCTKAYNDAIKARRENARADRLPEDDAAAALARRAATGRAS